jgi:hypothetical protein
MTEAQQLKQQQTATGQLQHHYNISQLKAGKQACKQCCASP